MRFTALLGKNGQYITARYHQLRPGDRVIKVTLLPSSTRMILGGFMLHNVTDHPPIDKILLTVFSDVCRRWRCCVE
jgi:hypothetical protein